MTMRVAPTDPGTAKSAVSVEYIDGVALIVLDDGKVNALDLARLAEVTSALDAAASASKAIVLAGRPAVFCAGLDLATMRSPHADEREQLRASGIRLFRSMIDIPVPVVAACTGHAIAGGAMFLLAADYRIAARGPYRIGLSEVSIGAPLSPLGLGLARLRLGCAAYRHTVLATFADVHDARRAGFVDMVVDEPVERSLALARRLGALSGGDVFSRAKATFYRSVTGAGDPAGPARAVPGSREELP